jgi:hypothetical protein
MVNVTDEAAWRGKHAGGSGISWSATKELRLSRRSTVGYWATVVTVNILILAALLLAAEGAYRVLSPAGQMYRRSSPGERGTRVVGWARPDDQFGWVVSGTSLHTFRRAHRKWSATVNNEGFRSPYDYRDRRLTAGVRRVMMLGDSFVFGPYLNDSDTLPSLLRERLGPGYEVDNFGIPGWGIDQMYLSYRAYVDIVAPEFVIAVYIDDDILRVFESSRGEGLYKPSYELIEGRLTLRTPDDPDDDPYLLTRLARISIIANRFFKYVYRPRVSAGIARAFFLELARETTRRGQQLLVVRYPDRNEILGTVRGAEFDLAEFFRNHRILYIDPAERMRAAGADRYKDFYLSDDAHPAREGNRFVANEIAEAAFAHQLTGPSLTARGSR